MEFEAISVENCDSRVLKISLSRPRVLNAINQQMAEELTQALHHAKSWPARCVLITGQGRAFCSGADLGSGGAESALLEDIGISLDRGMNPVIAALMELPMPVVSAVNGVAAGAGCSLALAADFVIAGRSAAFTQAYVKVGLVPDAGATWILPRTIGRARALEMMMLGEPVGAEQAAAWGLISRVTDDEALPGAAMALATKLAQGPTRALGEIRRLVRCGMQSSLSEALHEERNAQSRSGRTEDFTAGATAFRERREPVFKGA